MQHIRALVDDLLMVSKVLITHSMLTIKLFAAVLGACVVDAAVLMVFPEPLVRVL